MHIALTCQNRRTLSAHAGRCRHFLLADGERFRSVELDISQTLRESVQGGDWSSHPLAGIDVLITAGVGAGLVQGLARHGIRTVISAQSLPASALAEWLADPHGRAAGHPESIGGGGSHCHF